MKLIWRILAVTALAVLPGNSRATESPLPTLEQIFKGVLERARQEAGNDRAIATQYVYVKSRITEYRNGKGELKKQEIKINTNNPALRRLAQPSPKPSPPEAPDEPVSDTHSNVRGKAFERDEFALDGDLVKRFSFTLAGRETLQGRPALIVDFEPAKGKLPERTLKEKFLNKAAGRIWIDEQEFALVKVAVRLTERVNVVGGLVGAVKKFSYSFERERAADGLWLTRHSAWHLEGREVFVQRTIDYHEDRTDFHKPSAASGVEPLAGR